jgi:hypothetical protein
MKEVKVKLTVDSTDAKKGVDDVTKSAKKLDKEVGEVSKSSANLGGSIDTMTGGALSGFKKFAGGLKTVALGFRTIGGAIAASGIGLIVITIAAITAAFKSSEEGQNKFAKIMGIIGTLTSVLVDRLAALGTAIMDAFTNPVEALKGFRDSIKEYVTDQIALVTDGLGLLGSAIKKAFSGDFSGALDDAAEGANKLLVQTNPLVQATQALAGATKGLVDEMTEEARIAGVIADQRAAADKLDRALIVDRAEANRKRAELLDKAVNKELFSAKERIAFLTEAGEIEDEITEKEIAAAKLRLDAKTAENALGLSTKADLDEEANLKARLIDLETAKLRKAKLVTTQIAALNNEARADELAKDKELADKKKAIEEFTAVSKEEKRNLEKEKLREEFEALLEQIGADDDAKLLLEEAFLEKQAVLKNKYADEDLMAQKVIDDKAIADAKIISDKKIAEEKKVADAKASIQDASLGTIKNGLNLLKQLGEDSKALQATALIGESAVGIAEMVINKSKADLVAQPLLSNPATATAGATALLLNKINLGIGIATNVAATAKGLAALGKGGAPAGGADSAGGGAEAPAFNLVEGSESNAIQQSIQGQDNAVKAFVVSGDVTTAQSADRRIVEGSGF